MFWCNMKNNHRFQANLPSKKTETPLHSPVSLLYEKKIVLSWLVTAAVAWTFNMPLFFAVNLEL